jgi:hypothetical protein
LTDAPSSCTPVCSTCAADSADSTRLSTASSTLTVAFPLETWTAGDSPKKFGSV